MKPNKMRLIGITGGIGSGKTQVLEYIKQHYACEVYLADEISHQLMKKGQVCYEQLVQILGSDCLDTMGEIDKKKMAKIIFSDNDTLVKINAILHPSVKNFVQQKIVNMRKQDEVKLFFLEAALLIEEGYQEILDELWYIYAEEEIRKERLKVSRNYSKEKIDSIMMQQLPQHKFLEVCDVVIDNNMDKEQTHQQIRERLREYQWQE